MPKSKMKLCEDKVAKVNDTITKSLQEHNIDEITTNRNIFNYYYRVKEPESCC